ncbi:glycosyltransferase family 4 protein [Rhodococcoides fascians A21d2]|uniref:glycosyltransferase family 4 protein n=1 Tax=Rhodococcoides fascians TaxID=1828 RepID=UPI0012D33B48|nr:glycosyltransferase family 4 protein [Rhodococcus fascians]QIH99444.1 glycosyltransferase family 4 protein [Rhodococcus fascians A21d2]
MKILMIAERSAGGGAEEVSRNWLSALEDEGCFVSMLYLGQASPGANSLHGGTFIGHMSSWRKIREVRRICKDGDYDVVLSVLTYQNLLSLISTYGLKVGVVISEHNIPGILLKQQRRSQKLQLLLARRIYKYAVGCLAVSHAVAADLRSQFHVRADRIAVLPNAVLDNEYRSQLPVSDGPGRGHISGGGRKIQLLIPARLVQQKAPLFAVEIARALIERGLDTKLDFVGEGPLEDSILQAACSARVEIVVHPWTPSWHLLAGPKAVVLLPSSVEGFGNVLIHAARHRIPAVASSSALGVGDALIDGLTGALAENYSVDSFCESIHRAIDVEVPDLLDPWLDRFTIGRAGIQLKRVLNGFVKTDLREK